MSQLNEDRLRKYASKSDHASEKHMEDLLKITNREISELYSSDDDFDPRDKDKGGFYHLFLHDESIFHSFTGYTSEEFDTLYSIVKVALQHQGRGRSSKFESKEILIMLLFYLRRYPRFETIHSLFHVPESTFKGILKTYIPRLQEIVEQKFITEIAKKNEIEEDEDFKDCYYIVDATVQPIEIPKGSYESKKPYFSGKHGVYGLKSQAIVTVKGFIVHIRTGIKGGVHDKAVFDESLDDFKKKVISLHPDKVQKILGDKGYQDQTSDILVTPHKGNLFDLDDSKLRHNQNLGNKRVIIENFFGRLKSRYQITKDTYRSDTSDYSSFFTICCALVNYEIVLCGHPLRDSDSDYYKRLVTKMIKDAEQRKKLSSQKYKKYKKKRQSKFLQSLNKIDSDSDSDSLGSLSLGHSE